MPRIFNFGKRTANRQRGLERYVTHVRRPVLGESTSSKARWDYNAWLDNRNKFLLP